MTCADIRPLRDAQHEFRREYVVAALGACSGNLSKTALALQIHRTRLVEIMDLYGIARPRKQCEG